MTLSEEKRTLRRSVIAARRALPEETRQACDAAIARHVLESTAWKHADTVFLYLGTGWEIATDAIVTAALAEGKTLAVPRCLDGGAMETRVIRSSADLRPGAYGIPEPLPELPLLSPEETDLAIVPAVAYDRAGYRLGRGGGYYDRYLPRVRGITVGLAYQSLILDAVPREAHDCRVDLIITEEGEILWA